MWMEGSISEHGGDQMIIKIKDLRLRTTIGVHEWERQTVQDVVITVELEYDGGVIVQDEIQETIDYKSLTKKIILAVEGSHFYLLEKLTLHVLNQVMEDPRVKRAQVEIDKPHALRFADSVSVTCSANR